MFPAIVAALSVLLPEVEQIHCLFLPNISSGHIWLKVGAPSFAVGALLLSLGRRTRKALGSSRR